MVGKTEWDAIKKQHGNKCRVCGKTEKSLGALDKAHIKASSRGGSQVVPLCPNCHRRYDRILLNRRECGRLGIDYEKYVKRRYSPRRKPREDDWLW